MLKEFGGVAQLDGGDLGNLGALFARSNKDTPADIQARLQHLAIAAFDKQASPETPSHAHCAQRRLQC